MTRRLIRLIPAQSAVRGSAPEAQPVHEQVEQPAGLLMAPRVSGGKRYSILVNNAGVMASPGLRCETPEQGAATSVLVATSPLLDGMGGRYFEDCNEADVGTLSARHGVAEYALALEAAAPSTTSRRSPSGSGVTQREHRRDVAPPQQLADAHPATAYRSCNAVASRVVSRIPVSTPAGGLAPRLVPG